MDITKAKNEIKVAKEVKQIQENLIKQKEQDIANYICPFKVVDKVVDSEGKKGIVARIAYQAYGNGYCLYIFKLKKDGTPYKNECCSYGSYKLFTG